MFLALTCHGMKKLRLLQNENEEINICDILTRKRFVIFRAASEATAETGWSVLT